MTNLWHWITLNWGTLGIGTGIGYCLGVVFNVFRWRYSSWADWKQERQEMQNKHLDTRVLQSFFDPEMPRTSGGMTGSGMPLSRISEIAAYLKEDRDSVADSLMRLEMRGRVNSDKRSWFPIPD
jgi:hypothetical protein